MKKFNTTAVCIPSRHYMVDISSRVEQIRKMVETGEYFTMNRARQYGKTTTLRALRYSIQPEYEVISLSFQGISSAGYASEGLFCQAFAGLLLEYFDYGFVQVQGEIITSLRKLYEAETDRLRLDHLFRLFRKWCAVSEKPVVLIIDEVDSASNNQVFLDFLAQLRDGYINREAIGSPAFQSVILAGVTDIKHLKSKIREEEQSKVNSPWNIAADFNIDMSFHMEDIRGMLEQYESDHRTGMQQEVIAQQIEDYTGGYPFLVSRICQLIDEQLVPKQFASLEEAWTVSGVEYAVKQILLEKNTLFDSLIGKLTNYPELKKMLKSILMEGISITYNLDQEELSQMQMYGFIINRDNKVAVSNRIFETRLYNLFLSEEELSNNVFAIEGGAAKNIFVEDGQLNMRLILEHFIETYTQVFGPLKDRFKEKDGRELFLLYLRPIINGTGNYYIEAETRDHTRTDVIIDYLGLQYVIELKIWRGPRYNEEGERQLKDYLDYFNLKTGYMLSFNFNKKKESGVKRITIKDKILYEATL